MAARAVLRPLQRFIAVAYGNSLQRARGLEAALRDEVPNLRRGRPGGSVKRTSRQQTRRIHKMARALQGARAELSKWTADGWQRGVVSRHWQVSAGLSDPNTSTRSVETWCREFNVDGNAANAGPPLSHSYVSTLRSVFGQLLLDMNRADVMSFAQAASDGFLVIRHLHDEATMRLRSTVEVEPFRGTTAAPAADPAVPTAVGDAAPAAAQPRRGRSSKIQNSVVTLHHGPADDARLEMLLELQPLGRKDARTLATALHEVASVVAQATHRGTKVIHCLVGDGVPTNAAAARTLMEWMHRDGRACTPFLPNFASTPASPHLHAALTPQPSLRGREGGKEGVSNRMAAGRSSGW